MYTIISPFLHLCIFRIGPQNLPTSLLLLSIVLAGYTASEVVGFMVYRPSHEALLAGLLGTVLLTGLTISVLCIQRHQTRLIQTLTALFGALTVLNVLELPLTSWLLSAHTSGTAEGAPLLLLMMLIGWSLTVQGNILRHALSTPLFMGLMISMFFFAITNSVTRSMFLPPQ